MYNRIAKEQMKRLAKLSLEQKLKLRNIYTEAIKKVGSNIQGYEKELKKQKAILENKILNEVLTDANQAAKIGTAGEWAYLEVLFTQGGADIRDDARSYYNRVQRSVLENFIEADIYKDNKTLDDRIWELGEAFEGDIQSVVEQGLALKKSPAAIAKDLEEYVKEDSKKSYDIKKTYPLMEGEIDYNAFRLARTTIVHAYQIATVQAASKSPFVLGMKWLNGNHGNVCDICRERAETDHAGLGEGVYPIDEVPLDHPNGMCTIIPYHDTDLDDEADRLNRWLRGYEDEELDEWYQEHGEYFITKEW